MVPTAIGSPRSESLSFWIATPRTQSLWQRDFPFDRLIGVATSIVFGEKRCRRTFRKAILAKTMTDLPRDRIIGSRLIEIGHSSYSGPEFILQGIGPAQFRSHYIRLDCGLVLDLCVYDVTLSDVDTFPMPGETSGLDVVSLTGRRITSILNDDTLSPIVVFDNGAYLRDANDGCYGNPLHAGYVETDYDLHQRTEFTDFWAVEDGPIA